MTDLLERALETARSLPPEMQDAMARLMLSFAGDEPAPIDLTPEEEAALARSEADEARGEFATEEEIAAIWAKLDL